MIGAHRRRMDEMNKKFKRSAYIPKKPTPAESLNTVLGIILVIILSWAYMTFVKPSAPRNEAVMQSDPGSIVK